MVWSVSLRFDVSSLDRPAGESRAALMDAGDRSPQRF
jgi:hypothetical protein